MKKEAVLTAVFVFIILATTCYAYCEDPINAYHDCLGACPDAVTAPESSARCGNTCIGSHMKANDAYLACQRQEREEEALAAKEAEAKALAEKEATKKALEEQKKKKENATNKTHVSNVLGRAFINRKDKTLDYHASKYDVLQDGDTITTDGGSFAEIMLPDGHTIKMAPKSEFTYHKNEILQENIVVGANSVMYEILLLRGKFHFFCKQSQSRFKVRTPPGSDSTRATEFIVDYDPVSNVSITYLREGIVDVNDTKNHMYTMNIWETVILDSSGFKEITTLSQANWDGLVASIENGTEFTLLPETSKPIPENLTKAVQQESVGSAQGVDAQKTQMPWSVILIGVIIVVAGVLIFSKRKKLHKK